MRPENIKGFNCPKGIRETTEPCNEKHFSSAYCLKITCKEYRKNDDGVGQKCCQVTGYIPGNMPQCPLDMDATTFLKYSRHNTRIDEPEPGIIPAPKPAPCKDHRIGLFTCPDGKSHFVTEQARGRVCDAIGIPLNQLPHNECLLDREVRLKGTLPEKFRPASDDGFGNKFVKPAPYKIVPVKITKEQFIEAVRGYLTPKTLAAADDLVKLGQLGEDYAELVEALIWEVRGRMEAS